MSEFQCYEFQAIERPLDEAARAALRRISSRARITAHSLVNTYEWGDFKGEPRRLMADWFDLFVYWANWGARTAMLRLPGGKLVPADVRPYAVPDVLEVWTAGEHTLLAFHAESDGEDEEFDVERGASAAFVAVRADLLAGDRRALYLGWLLGVQYGLVEDGAAEPPRPPGLDALSGALMGCADFLGLDQDLLDAAGDGSAGAMAGELRAQVAARRAERAHFAAQRRAEEAARRDAELKREREAHLARLAERGDRAWLDAEALAEAKQAAQYDRAVALLKDMEALADRGDKMEEFHRRLEAFRERHRRKPTLLRRLATAGLARPSR